MKKTKDISTMNNPSLQIKSNTAGITLIALVITIIVLLILAGVSISLVVGENGVLSQATTSVEETRKATAREQVALAWTSADAEYWKAWTNNSSVKKSDYLTVANLNKYLDGKGTVSLVKDNENGTHTVKYTSAEDNIVYEIVVDSRGKTTVASSVHKSEVKETLASKITAANYGDEVTNYEASNGYKDWKIFYSNGTNVFLIASDYVPKEKVDTSLTKMTQDATATALYSVYWNTAPSEMSVVARQDALFGINASSYTLNSNYASSKCVSTLLDTANWTGFKDAKEFGEYVIGSPTVEMWMASWNAKGRILGTDKYESLKTENGTYGYYVGPTATESLANVASEVDATIGGYQYKIAINSEEGYADTLYFPHQSEVSNCYGYWLASPSASDGNGEIMLYVSYSGFVNCWGYYGQRNITHWSVRPVVALSSEILGNQDANGKWTLSK